MTITLKSIADVLTRALEVVMVLCLVVMLVNRARLC